MSVTRGATPSKKEQKRNAHGRIRTRSISKSKFAVPLVSHPTFVRCTDSVLLVHAESIICRFPHVFIHSIPLWPSDDRSFLVRTMRYIAARAKFSKKRGGVEGMGLFAAVECHPGGQPNTPETRAVILHKKLCPWPGRVNGASQLTQPAHTLVLTICTNATLISDVHKLILILLFFR